MQKEKIVKTDVPCRDVWDVNPCTRSKMIRNNSFTITYFALSDTHIWLSTKPAVMNSVMNSAYEKGFDNFHCFSTFHSMKMLLKRGSKE